MKGGSSQRGARSRTNGASIGRASKAKAEGNTDWTRLRRMSAAEIRKSIHADSGVQATDETFWKNARVVWPVRKEIVTMRLDADLLRWFRQQRGYQTRINAILRAYMSAHGAAH
jgi:uncharacterized protein (DUF4415 family)